MSEGRLILETKPYATQPEELIALTMRTERPRMVWILIGAAILALLNHQFIKGPLGVAGAAIMAGMGILFCCARYMALLRFVQSDVAKTQYRERTMKVEDGKMHVQSGDDAIAVELAQFTEVRQVPGGYVLMVGKNAGMYVPVRAFQKSEDADVFESLFGSKFVAMP